MNKFSVILLTIFGLYLSACDNKQTFQRGDLIFEIAPDNEMSQAIAEATAQRDSVKFSHVGIIDISPDGKINVIEATAKFGVTVTPIDEFIDKATAGAVVKRLVIPYDIDASVGRAKSFLGRPYDWTYLPNNHEIYCSELVEKSYITADGSPVFQTIPMNFRDKDGNMPQFWIDLFERAGRDIPEGVPGTNPTQISRSADLEYIFTIEQ